MLSDRGIRDAIAKERIIIDPFEPGPDPGSATPNLGTNSYNLAVKYIFRLARGACLNDVPPYTGLETERDNMLRFIERYTEPFSGTLLRHGEYIGITKEKVRSAADVILTTRSSAARRGVEFQDASPQRWHYLDSRRLKPHHLFLKIRSYVPRAKIPEGKRLVQAVFDPSPPLKGAELAEVVKNMKCYPDPTLFSQTRFHKTHRLNNDGIVLHAGNKIKVHNGETLDWEKDDFHAFHEVDVTGGYKISGNGFCIVPSLEYIELPPGYAGWLWNYDPEYDPHISPRNFYKNPTTFMIHPNAPLFNGGSRGNQIFETWNQQPMGFSPGREEIRDEPELYWHEINLGVGKPISILSLHRLDQEPKNPYDGKYARQSGAQVSLSHLD